MRVLIYENTKDRGKLIQDLLSTYRYKTYLNTDQPLSVDKIHRIKPSLLIININNPSHIELLENLKNNKKTNRIPIILISISTHLVEIRSAHPVAPYRIA